MRAGKWAKVFIDGYAVTTYATDLTVSTKFDELDTSTYTQDKRYIPGQGDSSITLDGYFNPTTIAAVAASSGKVVSVVLGNNAAATIGSPSFSLAAAQSEITVTAPKDGLQAGKAKFAAQQSNGGWGVMLTDAVISTDSNGTSVDNGAATAAGGAGYLHVYGVSASDTAQVAIQHSTNNSTWVDLGVFTLNCSAIGAERIEIAGNVYQYVRAEWDVTGTDVAISIAVFFQRY